MEVAPTEVRLLPSNRDWVIGILSLRITFQWDGSRSLRPGYKIGNRHFKKFAPQRGRKPIYSYNSKNRKRRDLCDSDTPLFECWTWTCYIKKLGILKYLYV